MIIRPVAITDLPALQQIAVESGPGSLHWWMIAIS